MTLLQPWASLVAIGAKQIETRSWSTQYRGWLAIHASKGFPRECRHLIDEEPFAGALIRGGYAGKLGYVPYCSLPLGAIVAVANLHAVGVIGRRSDGAVIVQTQELPVTGDELTFGDYTPGRYGWRLSNIQPLNEPIACRGALSLWDVPAEVEAEIRRQMG